MRFFNPERAGELVYLDKDDDAFAEVCADLGVDVALADEALALAVRPLLKWKTSGRAAFSEFDQMAVDWTARRRRAKENSSEEPPPPHLALLTLFSLAAERIGSSATGAIESGYYSNLELLLKVPPAESGRFRTSFMRSSEAYWELLSHWLENQDGQRGLPSAYALMHRYVGLPVSQALVRVRERRNLLKMFEDQGFSAGMAVSQTDMHGALDIWISSARTSANAALVKMWASADLRSRIVEIALAELAAWQGPLSSGSKTSMSLQKSGRSLLTLRDGRVGLRSEMRFGVVLIGDTSAGEKCRVSGADGSSKYVNLEVHGLGALGFDFRAGGIDAGSAIGGDLRLVLESGRELQRFPKNVVILTRDAFSAGYVESDRINAATLSRILVKDESQLVAKVEAVLADAAQPGYQSCSGGTAGVPNGWTVFTDVVLLRAPAADLVQAQDLSAFQPRLSTHMTITGGLKMPGRVARWSAISPFRVTIASDTNEKVDLVVSARNSETLLMEECKIHAGLTVPASVDLEELEGKHIDLSLSLRRGKTTLQSLSVKLRSSQEPTPDINDRFKSLCHDLSDPLWPINCTPNENATSPGLDGIALSAPWIPHAARAVPVRPTWARVGQVRQTAQLMRVAGPHEKSCIVTGRHRFDFPTFDGRRPKASWMYGICIECGMSRRSPTKASSTKAIDFTPRQTRAQDALPKLTSLRPRWDALIDALFYLGAGSRQEFSKLARQLEDSAVFEHQLLRDLEALGIVELERSSELDVVRWEAAATCLAQLADRSWMFAGFWNLKLKRDVLDRFELAGASVLIKSPDLHASVTVDGIARAELDSIAEEFGIEVVSNASMELARALPALSTVRQSLKRSQMPFSESYEYFSPQFASWLRTETAGMAGLYRISKSYSSVYYFRSSEDIIADAGARVTVELGKHLAALELGQSIVAYNPDDSTLMVPVGAELPGVYGRAAVMGAGELPRFKPLERSVIYDNVPPAAAEALFGKLNS